MEERKFTCCICGGTFKGWGNNPEPVVNEEGARCCDACNSEFVIPIRLLRLYGREGAL